MKKPRKRRSDAVYATAKERQAAYRRRVRDSRLPIKRPSPAPGTDSEGLNTPDASVTVFQDSAIKISPENTYAQQTTSYSSAEESYGNSNDTAEPFTPNGSSESEVLQIIEEKT